MDNITREDIADYINKEFGLSKKDCNDLVNSILEEIQNGLIENQVVKIHNFGTFKLKRKNSRIGRNPKTKEDVMIEARNIINFYPSKKIKNYINNPDFDG